MSLANRRLTAALLTSAVVLFLLWTAVVLTMTITEDMPDRMPPLYYLSLLGLVAFMIGAAVLHVGMRLLAAIRRLPSELGVDRILLGQERIIERQITIASSLHSRTGVVRVLQQETIPLPALPVDVVQLPCDDTVRAFRRLARRVCDLAD